MNVGNLGRVLKQELARSKKKTAALGLMILVAVYFWVPLIHKYVAGKSDTSAKQLDMAQEADSSAPLPSPQRPERPTGLAPLETKIPWKQLVTWMRQDRYMQTASLTSQQRNPFQFNHQQQVERVESQHQPQQPEDPPGDVTPQQLGLQLRGTIVGSTVPMARINNKTYRANQRIRVRAEGPNEVPSRVAADIEFVLVEVHPKHVVLERNGARYALRMPRPKLRGNERITIRKSGAAEP